MFTSLFNQTSNKFNLRNALKQLQQLFSVDSTGFRRRTNFSSLFIAPSRKTANSTRFDTRFRFELKISVRNSARTTTENLHSLFSLSESEIEMRKNRWFVLFPEPTSEENLWSIKNRSSAFDLHDDLKLEIFERFCFLKPKIPFGKPFSLFSEEKQKFSCFVHRGFPLRGLLNRCPKASPEFCLKNGNDASSFLRIWTSNFLFSVRRNANRTRRTVRVEELSDEHKKDDEKNSETTRKTFYWTDLVKNRKHNENFTN